MRITLAQLLKTLMPYRTTEVLDLSNDLVGFEDILEISPAEIEYRFQRIDDQTYSVKIKTEIDLILEGPVSLKKYSQQILVDTEEIFSSYEYDAETFVVEGQTLDTKEAVIMNLLLLKPMRVEEDEEYNEAVEEEDLEEENMNPAFANLKDLL